MSAPSAERAARASQVHVDRAERQFIPLKLRTNISAEFCPVCVEVHTAATAAAAWRACQAVVKLRLECPSAPATTTTTTTAKTRNRMIRTMQRTGLRVCVCVCVAMRGSSLCAMCFRVCFAALCEYTSACGLLLLRWAAAALS